MNEAIKLAIEKGGYDAHWNRRIGVQANEYDDVYTCVLDGRFWQALGKALGWDDSKYTISVWKEWLKPDEQHRGSIYSGSRSVWLDKALSYHELVLTGGDTEKFWWDILH